MEKKINWITYALLGILLAGTVYAQMTGRFAAPNPDTQESIEQPLGLSFEAKVVLVEQYLSQYGPLNAEAATFVEVAEEYDLDWRLLPAISVQESTAGKHMCGLNPFGWGDGLMPEPCPVIRFSSIDAAIWHVGQQLAESPLYADKTTYQKLWTYNGTVNANYPNEVMAKMAQVG